MPRLRSPLARRAAIQLVKRSPVDLRRPLGIEPRTDAAAIAHVLSAYARDGLGLAPDERRAKVEWAVAALRGLRSDVGEGSSWSYHFDVETRFFFYSADTPNTIATAFTGLALLDAYELTGEGPILALAEETGEFLLGSIARTEGEGGAYFGYFPGDRTPIHNASLLACGLLARLAIATAREDFRDAARSGVGYALAHQRPDGSWPYAEVPAGDWVDGFHTGYVLDSLLRCAPALPEAHVMDAWRRGIDFYERRLFDRDGAPRFTVASRYPIDGQSVAQAIESFARAAHVDGRHGERAWRSFDFATTRMRRRDGAFIFQRGRWVSNRVPHLRWVQAPMLAALATLAGVAAREPAA